MSTVTAARERVLDHLENVAPICVLTGSAMFVQQVQSYVGQSSKRVTTRTFNNSDYTKHYLVIWDRKSKQGDAFGIWLERMERDFGLKQETLT